MANVDRVNGFKPVGHKSSASYNGQATEYWIKSDYAVNLFVGDAVELVTGSSNTDGLPEIQQSIAGNVNTVGVIVGFKVNRANAKTEHPGYSAASTEDIALVCDDPEVIYEVQENGNGGVAMINSLCDHVVAAGSTTTGASGMELASSTSGTADGQWRVLQASRRLDNEPANTNAKWLVMLAEQERRAASTGL